MAIFDFLKTKSDDRRQQDYKSSNKFPSDNSIDGALEVIRKAFPRPMTRAIVLAYISNPEITEGELDNILGEIQNSYDKEDKEHAERVKRAVKNLYNFCSDETVAQKLYLEVLNMSRKNLITLDKMIFQQLLKYARDEEFSREMRSKTRSKEKQAEPT
jgi:hypothetical protein